MPRLETLGGLVLRGDAGTDLVSQRRRLALLALLAVAGERGLARDKVLAYLWAESSTENARHSVDQLVYALRRELGAGAVVGESRLRLGVEAITSDVSQFERAVDRGEWNEAVALYQGAFLDGFFLSDAPEFERWVEAERTRLAARYAITLEHLAESASAARDHRTAIDWRRKLAALDPLSATYALGLMRAFAAAGDRAGALQHARVHETRTRAELDVPADPALTAFAKQLREEPEAVPRNSALATAFPRELHTAETSPVSSASSASPVIVGVNSRRPLLRQRRALLAAAGSAVAIGLSVAAMWAGRQRASARAIPDELNPRRVAIVPWRVTGGDTALDRLGERVAELLAPKFHGEDGLIAVDPHATLSAWRKVANRGAVDESGELSVARTMRAGLVLVGSVAAIGGGQLEFNARLLSAHDARPQARAQARGSADSLAPLAERLAAMVLARHAQEPEERVSSLINASLPAVHAYLAGREASQRGAADTAISRYGRAIQLDSTFGLAGLELALASGRLFMARNDYSGTVAQTLSSSDILPGHVFDDASRAVEIAWRQRERFGTRDRVLLTAIAGPRYPDISSAREILGGWDAATRVAPERADVLDRLGIVLLRQGAAMGLANWHERATAAFREARRLNSASPSPLAGLIDLAAYRGDEAALRRLATQYLSRDSVSDYALWVRWRHALSAGDSAAVRSFRARFMSLPIATLDRIQWSAQVEGISVGDADLAILAILSRSAERTERGYALNHALWLALNRGRPREAARRIQERAAVFGDSTGAARWRIVHALYWDADTGAAADVVRAWTATRNAANSGGARRQREENLPTVEFQVDLWNLWHGDTTTARRFLAEHARRRGASGPNACAGGTDAIRAAVAAALVASADAAALLDCMDSVAARGFRGNVVPHHIDLAVARLRERAGDLPGALRAIRRQRWFRPPEYLSTALREEGRLAELTGDRAGAIRAYRQYLALRSDPEPSLVSQVDSVRAALARLER